jgi:hypothetical protein
VVCEAYVIPESAEQEARNKNDPETDDAMGEVRRPTPGAIANASQDATGNEVSTEDKKDNHGLMAGLGEDVKDRDGEGVVGDLRVVHEEEVAGVAEGDDEGCETTQEIE